MRLCLHIILLVPLFLWSSVHCETDDDTCDTDTCDASQEVTSEDDELSKQVDLVVDQLRAQHGNHHRKTELLESLRASQKTLKRMEDTLNNKTKDLVEMEKKVQDLEQTFLDSEKRSAELEQVHKELTQTMAKLAELLNSQPVDDIVHKVWRLKQDIRDCAHQCELDLKEQLGWESEKRDLREDFTAMFQLENDCKEDLKACEENIEKYEAQADIISCKDGEEFFRNVKDINERIQGDITKKIKEDLFQYSSMQELANCEFQMGIPDNGLHLEMSKSKELGDMEHKCAELKYSWDSCMQGTWTMNHRIEKLGTALERTLNRLEECKKKLAEETASATLDPPEPTLYMYKPPKGEIPKPTPHMYKAPKVDKTQQTEHLNKDMPIPTLYKYKIPEDVVYLHAIPWKPDEVPDITNLTEKEIRTNFAILKQDYEMMWALGDESSDAHTKCMKQRQDVVVLKYFMSKELYEAKVELMALKQKLREQEDQCAQGAPDESVPLEEFDQMKTERTKCLEDIKAVRKKAASDARELKTMRQDYAKMEKDNEKYKKEAADYKAKAEHYDFMARGSKMVIDELEQTEHDQKAKVEKQETEVLEAIKGAEVYKRYFAMSMVLVSILLTLQFYSYITAYLASREEAQKEAKRQEKIEKQAKKKLKTK